MTEGDPRDIRAIIKELSGGKRPLDTFLGGCLAEICESGQYATAIVFGPQDLNEKKYISLLRIVALRRGEIQSLVLTFEHNKNAERRMIDHLLQLTARLPLDRSTMRPLAEIATRSVQNAGLMTLAAMQVGNSIVTGEEIVEVIYPKTYREVIPLPEDYKKDLALGLAIHYLKNVPFGKGNISIYVPSH